MSATQELVLWLKERHADIMEREKDALNALYTLQDGQAHRDGMLNKAKLIAALDEDADARTEGLPEPLREHVASSLRRFAKGARNALRIDSVFYMAALLYPDEHKDGEPDNLQRLIRELEGA